jgi:pyruvate-ferredoxin/flavodoxin oxidoreductase
MRKGLDQQKLAVQSGYWPLYRYNPALLEDGKNPFILDSKEPTLPLEEFAYNETRYRMLVRSDAERADTLMGLAKKDVQTRWKQYQKMAAGRDQESEQ